MYELDGNIYRLGPLHYFLADIVKTKSGVTMQGFVIAIKKWRETDNLYPSSQMSLKLFLLVSFSSLEKCFEARKCLSFIVDFFKDLIRIYISWIYIKE